ncbi:hypothetical protein, partial [Haloferula sp.]|uniref:hypothetical protein n=1 Tax=Haloferula sp. TaxID=2497595 RepID=UPI003C73E5AC
GLPAWSNSTACDLNSAVYRRRDFCFMDMDSGGWWSRNPAHLKLDMGVAGDPKNKEKRYSMKFDYDLKTEMDPKQMILTLKDEANELVVNQAIYELNGDKLTFCMTFNSRAGIVQPFSKAFEVKEGEGLTSLFTLQRVKK